MQAGADYPLGRGSALLAYLHFWGDRFSRNDIGFSIRGHYRITTAAFMSDQNFSRRPVIALYSEVGVALQQKKGVYAYTGVAGKKTFGV